MKKSVFLQPSNQAEVAQLVEHNLAKVGVASSSLVFRSTLLDLGVWKDGSGFPNRFFMPHMMIVL